MKALLKFFTLLLLVSFISCGDDECETGYQGDNCDVLINEQFFGTYNHTTSDCGSGNSSNVESITLSADPGGDAQKVAVTLVGSNTGTGTGEGTLIDGVLTATGDVTFISTVDYSFSGNIVDNTFTGTVTASQGSASSTCDITMDK